MGGGGGGMPRFGGGGGGPRVGGGGPRFGGAAGAPRIGGGGAAPRVGGGGGGPRVGAGGGPRFSSPRGGAAHVASPRRGGAPSVAQGRGGAPSVAQGRGGARQGLAARPDAGARVSRGGQAGNRFGRNVQSPTEGMRRNALTGGGRNADNLRRGREAPTVGQAPGGPSPRLGNLGRDNNFRGGRDGRGGRGSPILRNAAIAGMAGAAGAGLAGRDGLRGRDEFRGRDSVRGRNDARAFANTTFRGGFAQSDFGRDWRRDHRHRHAAFVIGFAGPLFWPYAYSDFYDYTYSPYAYDTFWPYAFDDVYTGIYGGYAPDYYEGGGYAYAGASVTATTYATATGSSTRAARRGRPETTALAPSGGGGSQICSGETQGLTDFPIERIAEQVGPDPDQQKLLEDLKAATVKAVEALQEACPTDLPSTPTARLAAMRTRVAAMQRAVALVRPALERFYASLSDEQKSRFNAIDQATTAGDRPQDIARLCGNAPGAASLPVDRIARALRLTDEQDAALKALNDASAQAADLLKMSCTPDQALTPTGRLAAMQQRLDAMMQALDTVQPALVRFYGSLSDEQKAQFNRIGARAS
jgi:LTXXQ motif family protein